MAQFMVFFTIFFLTLLAVNDRGCETLPLQGPASPLIYIDQGQVNFDPSVLVDPPISVSFWFFTNDSTTIQYDWFLSLNSSRGGVFLSMGANSGCNSNEFTCYIDPNYNPGTMYWTSCLAGYYPDGTAVVGVWHYYAATYDNTTVLTYMVRHDHEIHDVDSYHFLKETTCRFL